MSTELVVDAMRIGWLTLAFMMLASRVVFQAKGTEWMRSFLDGWRDGGVKRAWGGASLAFAVFLAVGAATSGGGYGRLDALLLAILVLVLTVDGLVNVTRGGFGAFKDRMQQAWVARHRRTGRETDRHLFATVNLLLAIAAAGAAAVVIAYRPIATEHVALAAALALTLTGALLGAASARR